MNIHNHIYKKLFILYVSFFVVYAQAQEVEKIIHPVVKKITRRDSKGIERLDLLIKQKASRILDTLTADFNALTNRIVDVQNNLTALALVVNNLSITTQLGLIQTTAASPILQTPLVIIDSSSEDVTYNTDILTALTAVSIALHTPSKNNTATAQSDLVIAIADFDMIDSLVAVISPYSISQIYTTLIQLNAQLEYLYSLQAS